MGFDYITTDNEATRRINDAYVSIVDGDDDWTFCEADAAGASPLTIEDLRKVATVRDTSTGAWLPRLSRDEIISRDLDPATTGSPVGYYIDAGTIVRTYPVGGTIAVRYWKVPPPLVTDEDEPVIPVRFRDTILLAAAHRQALIEADPRADAFSNELQMRLNTMRGSLMGQHLEPDSIRIVYGGDDWA
jgi:hypothetical protein